MRCSTAVNDLLSWNGTCKSGKTIHFCIRSFCNFATSKTRLLVSIRANNLPSSCGAFCPTRVHRHREDDGDELCRLLKCGDCASRRDDDLDLEPNAQDPDGWQFRRLLPTRRERPRSRRAAEERDELAAATVSLDHGLASEPTSEATTRSAIDLPEHDVERSDDRRDVGKHMPAAQEVHRLQMGE
jgi:hypothetical protein